MIIWTAGIPTVLEYEFVYGVSRFQNYRTYSARIKLVANQQLVTVVDHMLYCVRTLVPQVLQPGHHLRTNLRMLWNGTSL
jgi:hypothetical protein